MKTKIKDSNMEVGKKYKGYGLINKFGEFSFQPEATGSQAGREKLLKTWTDEMVTIKETKNFLIVTLKEEKIKDEPTRARSLMNKFNLIFNFLKSHEI